MEEARAKFWTKIAAAINEANRCKSGANMDAEEIRRDQEYTDMELEGRLKNSLLGQWKYLVKILRASERDKDNERDRSKSTISQISEAEGMVRESRDRERRARSGIPPEGSLSRLPIRGSIWGYSRKRQGITGPSFEAEVRRLASNIDGVRERSEGSHGQSEGHRQYNRFRGGEEYGEGRG